MYFRLIEIIKVIFSNKDLGSRNISIKRNVTGLFFLKGVSIGISFLLIPLTLRVLDDYRYGIWITIFNLLSWISILDIGIGNGLRNKYTECVAKDDFVAAKEYVSTSYVLLSIVAVSIIVVFVSSYFFIDWSMVFNARNSLKNEIALLVIVTFSATSIQFVLKLIATILIADHKSAAASFFAVVSNLLVICVLQLCNNVDLLQIGIIYISCPLLVFLFANIYLFTGKYKVVKPEIKFFDKTKIKHILGLGIKFFLIQIASLIIFQTDNFIILHYLSAEDVTPYNIVFKYFSVVPMMYSIFATPLWNAYTDAAVRNDFEWIRKTIKKQIVILFFFICSAIVLFFISKELIMYWIGKELHLSFDLLLGMTLYSIISVWNGVFSALLGGLSKVRLITILTMVSSLINIPLSIFFVNLFDGSSGVIYATILCVSLTALFGPIQCFYFVFVRKKTKFLDLILS